MRRVCEFGVLVGAVLCIVLLWANALSAQSTDSVRATADGVVIPVLHAVRGLIPGTG